MEQAEQVLEFWFGQAEDCDQYLQQQNKKWFSSALDDQIQQRFGELTQHAVAGQLNHWSEQPRTRLALILILDQFSRNLFRGTPQAFAQDPHALDLCLNGLDHNMTNGFKIAERAFFKMPLQHSENLEIQERSVREFAALRDQAPEAAQKQAEGYYRFAVLHRDIVKKFGRFPHRNQILGRVSTEEEKTYMAEGGQTFGQ